MSSHRGSSHGRRRAPPPSVSVPSAREMERLKQNEVTMRTKIQALEVEVETLKYRLDSLRKAKNTTVIRREREEVRISSPRLGRHQRNADSSDSTPSPSHLESASASSCSHGDLLKQVEQLNAQLLAEKASHERWMEETRTARVLEVEGVRRKYEGEVTALRAEVEALRGKYEREVAALREEAEKMKESHSRASAQCQQYKDLSTELEKLRKENSSLSEKLEEMIAMNESLRESGLLLEGKCEALLEDLSIKEAQWSQKEDRLTAEIHKQWGEQYHEWITKAEKKMEELQKINAMLQAVLKTKEHNPDLQ